MIAVAVVVTLMVVVAGVTVAVDVRRRVAERDALIVSFDALRPAVDVDGGDAA